MTTQNTKQKVIITTQKTNHSKSSIFIITCLFLFLIAATSISAMSIQSPLNTSYTTQNITVIANASATQDDISYVEDGVFQGVVCSQCDNFTSLRQFSVGSHTIEVHGQNNNGSSESAAVTFSILNISSNMSTNNTNTSSNTTSNTSIGGVQTAVDLGSASNFVILSKSGISTTGTTAVTGNIGVSPIDSTAITGFGLIMDPSTQFSTSSLVNGSVYAADYADPTPAMLSTAIGDMQTAYTDAAGRTLPDHTELGTGNIGGLVLAPGLYKWSSAVTIPQDVVLSGNASAIWIFQVAQTLDISSGKKIILTGGAQAKNIFWQVAGQTTVETNAVFNGNILDQTAVVIDTGATLNGRALAQTAVTLDANAVSLPVTTVNTNTTVNTTTNMTTNTTANFTLVITTPTEGQNFPSASVSILINANTTLDNITAGFDGASQQLLCENCSTYNASYPNTWDGGHSFVVVGMLTGTNHNVTRTFSINTIVQNVTQNTTQNTTTNQTNQTIGTFEFNISSIVDGSAFNSTIVPLQIDANMTLDNISASFDGASQILLCENCSTYSGFYPNTWNGGHPFTIIGMLNGANQTITRTFNINVDNSAFVMTVSSPADQSQFSTTAVPIQIDANTTLDNITASFDGANATLLCENCATYSTLYPYTWDGGHTFVVIGMHNDVNQTVTRTFSINAIVQNVTQNITQNTTTNQTNQTVETFAINISSPLEGATYGTTIIPLQIDANATLDNITASFDSASQLLLCENCSTYNASYPNTWDGGHSFVVIGMLNGINQNMTRTFSINTISQNTTQNATTNQTTETFEFNISSPINMSQFSTTVVPVQIDANATLDNISASFDGANATLLCENCSTFSIMYPYTWDGGHTFTVFAALNGTTLNMTSTFTISTPVINNGGSGGSGSSGGSGGGSGGSFGGGNQTPMLLTINSPTDQVYTSGPQVLITTTTPRNIYAVFDNSTQILLCANSASASVAYPFTWQGGHLMTVIATSGNDTQQMSRFFAITYPNETDPTLHTDWTHTLDNLSVVCNGAVSDGLVIVTPIDMVQETNPQVLITTSVPRDIFASFDNATQVLLCSQSTSATLAYPFSWQGQHLMTVTATTGNDTLTKSRSFAITYANETDPTLTTDWTHVLDNLSVVCGNTVDNTTNIISITDGSNGSQSSSNNSGDFVLSIDSPQTTVYGSSNVTVALSANAVLDSMSVSEDGASYQEVCTQCSATSFSFPNTWDGGHTLLVKGMRGGVEHDATVGFSIQTQQTNSSSNTSNTQFSAQSMNSNGNSNSWFGQIGSFFEGLVSFMFSNNNASNTSSG